MSIDWGKTTQEDQDVIAAIAERAESLGLNLHDDPGDELGLNMDIEAAHMHCPLRLQELYECENTFSFTHDIMGIQKNLNRKTGRLENFFRPRFSVREKKHKQP